ncbi:MAG: hypothetical protein FWC43_11460 [Planctomycetaceae bacterium]|nr:hypothetical protein [Planctomycetaceae bacterium]
MKFFGENVGKPYKEISLTITHESEKTLSGFLQFWGYHVNGFNDEHHCQKCLIGSRERLINRQMLTEAADDRRQAADDRRQGRSSRYADYR